MDQGRMWSKQAEQARRLAAGLSQQTDVALLEAVAREYDALARQEFVRQLRSDLHGASL